MDDKKIKALLGKRIRQLRKERGLTQSIASERAGKISEKRWSDIERGIYSVGLATLANIAKGLDVPIQELFRYEETRSERKNNYLQKAISKIETQITKMDKQVDALKRAIRKLKKSFK